LGVVGWIGMTMTSAEAVQSSRSEGGTAGRMNTRPAYGAAAARVRYRASAP
jgi:hypothetical protein